MFSLAYCIWNVTKPNDRTPIYAGCTRVFSGEPPSIRKRQWHLVNLFACMSVTPNGVQTPVAGSNG